MYSTLKEQKKTESMLLQQRNIHSPLVFRRKWSIEIVSSAISIAAAFGLILLLLRFDGQPSPVFFLGITLDIVIAFLVAISQACFLQPVIQGASQIRWSSLFGRRRPLIDDFDQFSTSRQGLWGFMLLLLSMRRRLSALLAAFFLMASASISMVALAVLSHELRYAPSAGNAAILQAVNDTGNGSRNVNDGLAMTIDAMYTRPDATYEFNAPECSTGNCNYPSFGSLAVCSVSHDITDRLYTIIMPQKWCYQQVEDKWDFRTWGPDICSNYSYAALSPTIYLDYFGSENLANTSNVWLNSNSKWDKIFSFDGLDFAENALNAVHTIFLDSLGPSWNSHLGGLPDTNQYLQHAHAVETLFYLCAQEFTVSTHNGTTSTNVTASLDYVTHTERFESSSDGYHYTTEYNRIFELNGHNYSYRSVDKLLGQMLMSTLDGHYNNNTYAGMSYMTPFSFATGNVLYHNPNMDGTTAAKRNEQMQQALESMMSNMARAMTNWLRSTGSPVQGQAEVLTKFVAVRWRFLLPLCLQIILFVCVTVWAMVVSKKQPCPLKNSPVTIPFSEGLVRGDETNDMNREDIEKLLADEYGHH